MTRHATPEQLAETIALVNQALNRIRTQAQELQRWETEANRGFPTTGTGRGSKGDHADPTHRAYLEGAGLSEQIANWYKRADRACNELLIVDGLGQALMPIDHTEWLKREQDEQGEGCIVCHRYGIWSAISRGGRCHADYMYRQRHNGQDAPEDVVLDREHVRKQRGTA